jgi:hypothetical protein
MSGTTALLPWRLGACEPRHPDVSPELGQVSHKNAGYHTVRGIERVRDLFRDGERLVEP